MPDRTPIALWRHSIRMMLWFFVGSTCVAAVLFLPAMILDVALDDLTSSAALWVLLPLGLVLLLVPLAIVFYFGYDLRRGDHLSVREALLAAIGGGALIVRADLLMTCLAPYREVETPDLDGYLAQIPVLLLLWAVLVGATTLGAWWADRTAQGPCAPRRRGTGASLSNDNGDA